MTKKPSQADVGSPAASGSTLSERIVLLFLVAATVVLAYVYFWVVPSRYRAPGEPFNLVNPMLDAEIGECVAIESTDMPQVMTCLRVREPGLVLHPREGPERLGIYDDLHRARPYLVCAMRDLPASKTCADAGRGRETIELFDLNGFGMPHSLHLMVDSIRPAWVQLGGRHVYVYQVQLRQYGRAARTWLVHLHPDAPVTGTVLRRYGTERGLMHWTIFTKAKDCR